MSGEKLLPFPSTPELSTLTLVVAPVWRSWTKTSELLLVSPATKLVAKEWKATKRPSLLMVGIELASLASTPALSTLTRSVVPGNALAPVRNMTAVSRPINTEAGINQNRRVFMAMRFCRNGSTGPLERTPTLHSVGPPEHKRVPTIARYASLAFVIGTPPV